MRSRFNVGKGSRLPAPEDGIVTSGRRGGWVATRWHEMLDGLASSHGGRLSHGKNFARNGRVRGLWFSPGLASAEVIEKEAQQVSVRVRVFSDEEWSTIIQALLGNLTHIASLLEGELPQELVTELEKAEIFLLPSLDEIDGDCDCDDYLLPCAHMSAVHHVLAEALDGEPFLIFTLRGRPREQLLAVLRKEWGDEGVRRPPTRVEPVPAAEGWFDSPAALPASDFRFRVPEIAGAGLRVLGPPPGGVDLLRALGPLYEKGSAVALEVALSEVGLEDQNDDRVRAFRRSVIRPAQPASQAHADSDLTEALVDALFVKEGVKSKVLALAISESVVRVREELLELEKLGIVYRTGHTRGTRWWLG